MNINESGLENILIKVASFLSSSKQKDNRLSGYALIGGLAVSVRGRPRATQDIDILISCDLSYFKEAFTPLAAELKGRREIHKGDPTDPISYLARIFDDQDQPIIDFLKSQWKWEDQMIAESQSVALSGQIEIPVIGAEDLIVLKLRAGGPQDLLDAEELVNVVSIHKLDREHLKLMAKQARVDKKLTRLLQKLA